MSETIIVPPRKIRNVYKDRDAATALLVASIENVIESGQGELTYVLAVNINLRKNEHITYGKYRINSKLKFTPVLTNTPDVSVK